MPLGQQLQQFGGQLQEAIAAPAAAELEAAKLRHSLKEKPERDPMRVLQGLMSDAWREQDPDKRTQKMQTFDEASKFFGPYFDRMKQFRQKMKDSYGDGDGEIPENIDVKNIKLSLPVDLPEMPEEPGVFTKLGAAIGVSADPNYQTELGDWESNTRLMLRNYAKERVPNIDEAGLTDYENAAIQSIKDFNEGITETLPKNIPFMVGTGYLEAAGRPRKGITPRTAKPKRGKKIKVTDGDETLMIFEADLPAARKEGFKRVK